MPDTAAWLTEHQHSCTQHLPASMLVKGLNVAGVTTSVRVSTQLHCGSAEGSNDANASGHG
eukprot:1151572-Pelagomonas_calceolata.AAC.4